MYIYTHIYRDTVDALVVRGDINYRIIDTAGIRKKGKVEYGAEFFMINRAFKAVKRAEVCYLCIYGYMYIYIYTCIYIYIYIYTYLYIL
jgi:predicted GTPase